MGVSDDFSADSDEGAGLLGGGGRGAVQPAAPGWKTVKSAPKSRRSGHAGKGGLICKICAGVACVCLLAIFCAFYFEAATRNVIYALVGGRKVALPRKAWVGGVMLPHFEQFLSKDDRILDFGTGSGMTSELLAEKGYGVGTGKITALDFGSRGYYGDPERFVSYDGLTLPFAAGSMDATISLSVMHHIPEAILASLVRQMSTVTERLLVIEDCWDTVQKNGQILGKRALDFKDSWSNFEWAHHPHTTKALPEWVEFFNANGFDVVKTQRHKHSDWGHTFFSLKSKVWTSSRPTIADDSADAKKRPYTCPDHALVMETSDLAERVALWEDPSCTHCRLYGDGETFPRCTRTRAAVAAGELQWSETPVSERAANSPDHMWWWSAENRRLRR